MTDESTSKSETLKETNSLLIIAQRDRELAAAKVELSELKRRRSFNLPVLIPVLVATIGATASIISVSVSQYYQAQLASRAAAEEAELQRTAQQSALERELLSIALEADAVRADSNLRFLAISGMIPTFRESVLTALDRGYSFSVAHGRGGVGFFADPQIEIHDGQFEMIWGNYTGRALTAPFDELDSHALQNVEQFCRQHNFSSASGFDVNCSGEDESAYVAFHEGSWVFIESGSANDYCFPLVEWVQCR